MIALGSCVAVAALAALGDANCVVVSGGTAKDAAWVRRPEAARSVDGALVVEGPRTVLWAPVELGTGDFSASLELMLPALASSGAGVRIDASTFGLDGPDGGMYTAGPLFAGAPSPIGGSSGKIRAGVPFAVSVARSGEWLECSVNGEAVMRSRIGAVPVCRVGVWGGRGSVAVGSFSIAGSSRRSAPVQVAWSAGGDVWDEVALPSIAALADGSLLVSGSAVRSDEAGKDVRRILLRTCSASGQWEASRTAGPEDLAGSDSTLIADGSSVHLLAQSGAKLKCMKSADGGKTWSAPADVALPAPRSRLAGHGVRVAVGDGASLLVPVYVPIEGSGRSVSLLRSADGGSTWTAGGTVVEPVEAPAVASLGGSRLALIGLRPNMAGRWIWMSEDEGATWGAPLACGGLDPGTARACVWRQKDGSLWLAESASSASGALRRWRSDDGGATWIEQLPVQLTPAGACAVAVGPDGGVWIAHEGGDFARREHVLVRKVQ